MTQITCRQTYEKHIRPMTGWWMAFTGVPLSELNENEWSTSFRYSSDRLPHLHPAEARNRHAVPARRNLGNLGSNLDRKMCV